MDTNIIDFGKEKLADTLWMKRLSFASILISSNMLQTTFTNTLEDEYMTSKQWLLLAIASSYPIPPTLSEAGEAMGCSRQNIKQIANILKKKGYLEYIKLEGDKNSIRLQPSKKWEDWCEKNEDKTSEILDTIFEGFEGMEIQQFFKMYCMLMDNIEKINQELIKNKREDKV